jgi:hypothetical protein
MSIQRDFLMRQLMQLFQVLEKIIRKRKDGAYEDAEEDIQFFYACLKIEDDISDLSIEDLLAFLEKTKGLNNEQIEMVAFVLKEQGEMAEDSDNKLDFFRKSYFLLDKVSRESASFSMDRQMKLEELKGYLQLG